MDKTTQKTFFPIATGCVIGGLVAVIIGLIGDEKGILFALLGAVISAFVTYVVSTVAKWDEKIIRVEENPDGTKKTYGSIALGCVCAAAIAFLFIV